MSHPVLISALTVSFSPSRAATMIAVRPYWHTQHEVHSSEPHRTLCTHATQTHTNRYGSNLSLSLYSYITISLALSDTQAIACKLQHAVTHACKYKHAHTRARARKNAHEFSGGHLISGFSLGPSFDKSLDVDSISCKEDGCTSVLDHAKKSVERDSLTSDSTPRNKRGR